MHWCLWSFGGNVVDENDKVIINSPETEKALDLRASSSTSTSSRAPPPGTTRFNNKAFLANEVHWTNNGISIYVAARNDPTKKDIADDMDHAYFPVGPVGKPTELHLLYPILAMNYTKYPQACKALIAYMLEAEQFNKWIERGAGLPHPLPQRLRRQPGLDGGSEAHVYRDVAKRTLTAGGLGSVGERAATAIADFVVLDMFANVCTGREDAEERHEDGRAPGAAHLPRLIVRESAASARARRAFAFGFVRDSPTWPISPWEPSPRPRSARPPPGSG